LQAAGGKQEFVRIKLKMKRSGYLSVAGTVNGKEVDLLVDTASPVTRLDRRRAERLGVKWEIVGNSRQLEATEPPFERGLVDSIALGPFRTEGIEVGVYDVSEHNRVVHKWGDPPSDGLLGADFLAPNSAVIDYRTCDLLLLGDRQ
jgi:predicted aspartyl protease